VAFLDLESSPTEEGGALVDITGAPAYTRPLWWTGNLFLPQIESGLRRRVAGVMWLSAWVKHSSSQKT